MGPAGNPPTQFNLVGCRFTALAVDKQRLPVYTGPRNGKEREGISMLNPRTASRTALERAYLAAMADKVAIHELPRVAAQAAAMPLGQLRAGARIRQAQQDCAPAQRLQVIQDLLRAGELVQVGKGRGARYHLAG